MGAIRRKMLAKHFVRKLARRVGFITSREREKDFILDYVDYDSPKQILDVGCWGSILPEELAQRGHSVVGLDVQEYGDAKGFTFVKCDLIKDPLPFEGASFDYITCLSTIEHVGIGYYGDGEEKGGDRLALEKIHTLLKDDGSLLITIPFAGAYAEDHFQRIHTYDTFSRLVDGLFDIAFEQYWIPASKKQWIAANRMEAEKTYGPCPESNNACFSLKKSKS